MYEKSIKSMHRDSIEMTMTRMWLHETERMSHELAERLVCLCNHPEVIPLKSLKNYVNLLVETLENESFVDHVKIVVKFTAFLEEIGERKDARRVTEAISGRTSHFALGFVFDETNETVLLQKSAHPGVWNGIGGKLEHGEEPLDAMKRESSFVPVKGWDFKFTFTCPGGTVHVFKAEAPLKFMTDLRASQETRAWVVRYLPIEKAPNLGWIIPLCLEKDLMVSVIKT